ncbi:hypothetical protein V1511DRAFT_478714 [Dipodascopsis uninucleata]
MSSNISQSSVLKNNDRSKRILISPHTFPRHHAPLSKKYASSFSEFGRSGDNSSGTKSSHTLSERWQSLSVSSRPELSPETQASLISVGMRVRKFVSEGYKNKPKEQHEAIQGECEEFNIINPFLNDSRFQTDEFKSDSSVFRSKKRSRTYDDNREDVFTDASSTDDVSDADTVVDEHDLVDAKNSDFMDAPFLLPKEVIMQMD